MSFNLRKKVQDYYGGIAKKVTDSKEQKSCCNVNAPTCCSEVRTSSTIYAEENLKDLPREAVDASLGCANPVLFAQLKEGEYVLDLGSGGGINVFMSARYVGPEGKVFGLDMTDEMLKLANKNKEKIGVKNVEFLKGYIEEIPIEDNFIDVVMSNCVINLSEEKEKALSEAYRVLKPGGRLAIADIITLKDIPEQLKQQAGIWCACIGGTITGDEYRNIMERVGFKNVEIIPEHIYTKEIIKSNFIQHKYFGDVIKSVDLDAIDGVFAGAYIKADK